MFTSLGLTSGDAASGRDRNMAVMKHNYLFVGALKRFRKGVCKEEQSQNPSKPETHIDIVLVTHVQ